MIMNWPFAWDKQTNKQSKQEIARCDWELSSIWLAQNLVGAAKDRSLLCSTSGGRHVKHFSTIDFNFAVTIAPCQSVLECQRVCATGLAPSPKRWALTPLSWTQKSIWPSAFHAYPNIRKPHSWAHMARKGFCSGCHSCFLASCTIITAPRCECQ